MKYSSRGNFISTAVLICISCVRFVKYQVKWQRELKIPFVNLPFTFGKCKSCHLHYCLSIRFSPYTLEKLMNIAIRVYVFIFCIYVSVSLIFTIKSC